MSRLDHLLADLPWNASDPEGVSLKAGRTRAERRRARAATRRARAAELVTAEAILAELKAAWPRGRVVQGIVCRLWRDDPGRAELVERAEAVLDELAEAGKVECSERGTWRLARPGKVPSADPELADAVRAVLAERSEGLKAYHIVGAMLPMFNRTTPSALADRLKDARTLDALVEAGEVEIAGRDGDGRRIWRLAREP